MAVWTREDSHEATPMEAEQKALIVLEGLKGRPIGELCAEHEISQAQYSSVYVEPCISWVFDVHTAIWVVMPRRDRSSRR